MEQILALVEPLLLAYGGKLGPAIQVLAFIGSLRVFMKPLVSLAKTYVEFSPSQSDNVAFQKVMDSKYYKVLCYFLDWTASVKLPQKK